MNSERINRERLAYDEDTLNRTGLVSLLKYCYYYQDLLMRKEIKNYLQEWLPLNCLELGSKTWYSWLFRNEYRPSNLTCLNLSKRELESGNKLSVSCSFPVNFHLGDAHQMNLESDRYDLVFGRAILHHLELSRALSEINRVMKDDGKIIFFEPLNINPFYKLYRYLNPGQRTIDERAFTLNELKIIRSRFNVRIIYYNIMSIPLGYISRMIYSDYKNPLARFASRLDHYLCKIGGIQLLASKCLIIGEKRKSDN